MTAKAAVGTGWSGASTTLRGTAGTGASTFGSANATTGGTAPASGDLVVGGFVLEDNAATITDSDTSNGSWAGGLSVGSSGGSATTNAHATIDYKIVSAGGHQTYDPSGGANECGAMVVALVPGTST